MAPHADIARLSLAELGDAFAEQRITPVDAVNAFGERIEEFNPALNAFLTLRIDEARAEAEESAERWRKGEPLSPIDGAPYGVKANIAVRGLPFHGGVKAYAEDIAAVDAPSVGRLKNVGAVALGILNMHEGALGATTDNPHFGRCANPWDTEKTPGGSSGGSAAAVAAGLCVFALGSDTMGSVRIPSAYCGIAGHKPTYGLVSGEGLIDLSPSLDHVGPHAKTTADLAAVLPHLAGGYKNDKTDAGALRIGVASWGEAVDVEPDVAEAFERASETLNSVAKTTPVDISGLSFGALRRRGLLISEVEGAAFHEQRLRNDPAGFSDEFRGLLLWGAGQPPEKIEAARAALKEAATQFATFFKDIDVLMAPTAPQQPFRFGDPVPANQADFTAIANFGGFPSTAAPATREGAPPASVQFMALRGRDSAALAAATAFEKERGSAPLPPGYF